MKHFLKSGAIALIVTLSAVTLTSAHIYPVSDGGPASPSHTTLPAAENLAQAAAALPEREEINKSFSLDSNARVEVTGIAGPVNIETTDGNTAQVHIVRMAQTQRELQCYETLVKSTQSSLSVRHNQFSQRAGCDSIRSRQVVTLRLPRTVELDLSFIGGEVNIGVIEGVVRLSNIAGRAVVAQAQAAEITSLASGLSLTLARVSDRGIRIRGVVGLVELNLARDLNTDLRFDNVLGGVRSTSPDLAVTRAGDTYRVRAGSGGALVSVSGINGGVKLGRV
jgi:hypothetical protein